jgi:hypothetical protein
LEWRRDPVTRDELIRGTRLLVAEGEALAHRPSLAALQAWIGRSDRLLSEAWGTMDRWHLAWLMVGRPEGLPRGRAFGPEEEVSYVREVAAARTAVLRASLDAAERQALPFLGEDPGQVDRG